MRLYLKFLTISLVSGIQAGYIPINSPSDSKPNRYYQSISNTNGPIKISSSSNQSQSFTLASHPDGSSTIRSVVTTPTAKVTDNHSNYYQSTDTNNSSKDKDIDNHIDGDILDDLDQLDIDSLLDTYSDLETNSDSETDYDSDSESESESFTPAQQAYFDSQPDPEYSPPKFIESPSVPELNPVPRYSTYPTVPNSVKPLRSPRPSTVPKPIRSPKPPTAPKSVVTTSPQPPKSAPKY